MEQLGMRRKIIAILCIFALPNSSKSTANKTTFSKKGTLPKTENVTQKTPPKAPTKKETDAQEEPSYFSDIIDSTGKLFTTGVKWYFDTVNNVIGEVESDEKKNKREKKVLELQEQINEQDIELKRLHSHLLPHTPEAANNNEALKLLGQAIVAYTNAVTAEKQLYEDIGKAEIQVKKLKEKYARYLPQKRGILANSTVYGVAIVGGITTWYATGQQANSIKKDSPLPKWNEELKKFKKQAHEHASKIERAKKSLAEATGDDKKKLNDFITKKNQEVAKLTEQLKELEQKKRAYFFRKKIEKLGHVLFQIITIGGAAGITYKILSQLIPAEKAPQLVSPTQAQKIKVDLDAAEENLKNTKIAYMNASQTLKKQPPYSADLRKDYALYTTLKKQIKGLEKERDDVKYENINGITKDIVNLATDEEL